MPIREYISDNLQINELSGDHCLTEDGYEKWCDGKKCKIVYKQSGKTQHTIHKSKGYAMCKENYSCKKSGTRIHVMTVPAKKKGLRLSP